MESTLFLSSMGLLRANLPTLLEEEEIKLLSSLVAEKSNYITHLSPRHLSPPHSPPATLKISETNWGWRLLGHLGSRGCDQTPGLLVSKSARGHSMVTQSKLLSALEINLLGML